MINACTKVRLLDLLKTQGDYLLKDSIESVYIKFAHKIKDSCMVFKHDEMMIEDWTGWSEILMINKYSSNDIKWVKLECDNHEVIIPDFSYVPVWDDQPYHGFHGEIKFHYAMTPIYKLNEKSKGRIFDGSQYFHEYSVSNFESVNKYDMYEILTFSGFYSIDNILLRCPVCGFKNIPTQYLEGYK